MDFPKKEVQEYRKKENRCYRILCEYLHLLRGWQEQYTPQRPDEECLLTKRQYEHMTGRRKEHDVIAY